MDATPATLFLPHNAQVVAGTNYRITFKTAESTCPVTETYTREVCRPKSQEVRYPSTTNSFGTDKEKNK
ncbi:hypothetical protein HPB48_004196 [Haemaphysalis longicornis]|uniref:Cystatin domain-containing protein n=1 Tax=Haemaphysalis longicornis TaxID=44386 RepID=A0A9J6GI69_HAELO|nr:hypothetical protein HPB48_004196 [Haemaphysalis longicornis]